ncbi:hypothetical protein [Pantoea ananatis]|uniref:glycine-rich domain-containing protein n=1 Tax=Pantoea ananas TaxID=553 RepID=UPI000497344A|nr:hypothetical protein [Pantoea ananatis]
MAVNNFKPFATGNGANVTSQADYEALASLISGFQSGKASSAQINKALRQSTVMASVLAQFISDSAATDVLDDGNPATILANLKAGMTALTPGRLLNVQVLTGSGTYVPSSGTKKIVVEATGAGGGAGGASAGGRSGDNYIYSVGGGGGAGAYAKFTMDSGFSNLTYSCGKGGLGGNKTGAPNSQGSAGGQTTFGTVLTLQGGGGGTSGTTNDGFSVGCAAGGGFGANTVNLSGSAKSVLGFGGSVGAPGYMINANGGNAGVGANSFLGYGGFGASNGPGGEARGFGSGGGGALTIQSNTSSQAGGNGGDGLIIVWEYA